MPRVRIKALPKPGQTPQENTLGEYIRGTDKKFKKGGKTHTNPNSDQGYPFQRDQGYMYEDMGGVITKMHSPEMDTNMYFNGGPINGVLTYDQDSYNSGGLHDQNLVGNTREENRMKKGGWMKGAVNPAHKGYCTPMSKSTCTGHRRAFAETMKKHHGFHKKEDGGEIYNFKQGGKYINAGPNTDLNPTTNHSIADYNPYVYFKNKNWYITSNPEDEAISESVKPVDRDVANIEAEKGEYIVKPGLTGLHKVTGKTHAEGGTPLFAEGGSFIFSNDPKLSFNKNEREAFGFKGDNTSKSKNTPAKVLSREVDPKEYNGYIATLESPDTDRIAKTTAGLMLEKLQQKLGQIAYLQENKKGTKPPDFSQGTAPVTQPEFQNIDEKMSEYAMGGYYDDGGPWSGRQYNMATGQPIDPTDAYPGGKTTLGKITPKGLSNNFNYPGGVPKLIKDWQGVGIDMTNMSPYEAQEAMYNWGAKNNPQALRNMWSTYGNTAQGQKYYNSWNQKPPNFDNLSDKELQDQVNTSYADGMLGARTFAPIQARQPYTPQGPQLARPDQPNIQVPPPEQVANPIQPTQQPNPTLPYQIKGKLTDSQIANLGYLGLQSLSINRYMPTRQQVSLPQVKLDQINAQPYVNQVNNQAHEAYELAAINPRTSALMGSNIRGTAIDQANQAIGNVANQNSQIGNQQNLTNLQQMTQQVMTNSQFNNQYYNEVQATNQNFDNERRFANNQFVSNLNNYQSQADKLAWQMASVNRYGTRTVTDPKTGKQYNLPTPLYETNKNGIQYNADVANLNMASGANRINTPQEISNIYRQFKDSGMPDVEAQRIVSAIIRSRTTKGTENQGPFFMQNPYGVGQ